MADKSTNLREERATDAVTDLYTVLCPDICVRVHRTRDCGAKTVLFLHGFQRFDQTARSREGVECTLEDHCDLTNRSPPQPSTRYTFRMSPVIGI